MRRLVLVGVTFAATLPAAAGAQRSSPAALEAGRRAVEISLPEGGGGNVGLWWVRSPATQLGLTASFGYRSQEVGTAGDRANLWSFGIGPALKRHVLVSGAIVPYWRAAAAAGFGGGSGSAPGQSSFTVSGGFGVDWFPVDRVSFGGHMGVRAGYDRVTSRVAGNDVTRDSFDLGTFRSGLTMQLFF